MENIKVYQFKTNINCGSCIASIKPHLDKMEGVGQWNVDTADTDKILTVEPKGATKEQIIETVTKAGYKIESIN